MRCLCCGKEFTARASEEEKEWGWHKACLRSFFGIECMPRIELNRQTLEKIAERSVMKGLTVPGVQRKMSLHLSAEKEARLTLVDYPTGYILKPQTPEYAYLPEFEQMAMSAADVLGIHTVPHGVIKLDGTFAYITRRVDRNVSDKSAEMYAMEDFCQLSGRITADKYKGSYENCGRIVRKYSAYEGYDLSELFLRVIGSFILGNSDMHLKNFSLIEEDPGMRCFRLSPAYDMLPVNIILPSDPDQMALTVNGKKRNIHRNDFLALAENLTLGRKAAVKIIHQAVLKKERLLELCDESLLPEEQKEKVKQLIEERCQILESALLAE